VTATRLDQLLALERSVKAEIARERRTLDRIKKIRTDALAALNVGAWNQRVFTACCIHYTVDTQTVLDGSRAQAAVDARHTFMWLMRLNGRSFPDIAAELGMDHTTAMYGVRRVEKDMTLIAAAAEIYKAIGHDPADIKGRAR
jgi:chromosomal replication initiation ATPase DnaA